MKTLIITTSIRTVFIFFFLLSSSLLKATHIVGGEINYECLGGNQYRITVRGYRDCTGIGFRDPAIVDFYNSAGTVVQTVSIPLPPTVVLTPTAPNPCTEIPFGVCVESVEYITTVNLPPIPGGYRIGYADDARNQGILNGPAGPSFLTATIPDVSIASCNTNPKFNDWPPVYICHDMPLSLDHSATDADGDSLVYSMCSPLEALSSPYPFSPPYSANDPLAGGMTINPQTGIITGTPPVQGRFVVGVCVSEYKNGTLISTTTRDFQFNVVKCNPTTTAAGLSALTDCANLGVTFFNASTNATSYLWGFGDGNTSTDFEPTHNYGAVGTYTASLIAFAANPACNDTASAIVAIADVCRPCGMALDVTTTNGECTLASGCYEITYENPCTSNQRVEFNYAGAIGSGPCPTNGGSTGGGSAPFFNDVSISIGGTPLPTTSTIQTLTYLGPSSPCAAAISFPVSATSGIIKFNAIYQGVQPGAARVNITGGTGPYTVQWAVSPVQTHTGITSANSISSVPPGNYTVVVTDANGCVESMGFTVDGPSLFSINASSTDVSSCGADDGTLSTNVTGANGTPTYSWYPGGYTSSNVNNVPPGTYIVTVTDDDNCPKSETVVIADADTITVSAITTGVVCPGDATGTATVVPATGGSGSYTYSWNTNPVSTGTSISNLEKNFYTVTATDDITGCTDNYSFTINGPQDIILTIDTTPASCYASTDGSATVSATGGNGGFTYLWSNGQTTSTASSLSQGTYSVTATDASGCSAQKNTTISSPPILDGDLVDKSTVDCAGNFMGAAEITVLGGVKKVNTPVVLFTEDFSTTTSPQWSISGSTSVVGAAFQVSSNQFWARNINPEAVWTSMCIDISSHTNIALSFDAATNSFTDPSDRFQVFYNVDGTGEVLLLDLHDANDIALYPAFANLTGSIPDGSCVEIIIKVQIPSIVKNYYFDNIVVSGEPTSFNYYDYSWSCTAATTAAVTGLHIGLCNVTVSDLNGCTMQRSIDIQNPGALSTSVTGTNSCGAQNNGTANALTTGGTAPYTYDWDCSGATTPNIGNLTPGTTCNVTVTDALGCVANGSILIGNFPAVTLDTLVDLGTCNNDASIDLSVLTGTAPYIYNWNNGSTTEDLSNLGPNSTYKVSVFDANNCFDTLSVFIPKIICGPEVSATAETICLGDTSQLTARTIGGIPPYTYLWDNSGTLTNPADSNAQAFPLATTTYTVIVTDNNGDKDTTTVNVMVNPLPIANAGNDATICLNQTTLLAATGGTNYAWNTPTDLDDINISSPTFTGSTTGSFDKEVTVVDANGCVNKDTVTITVNGLPAANAGNDVVICLNQTTILTGTGGISYSWSAPTDLDDINISSPTFTGNTAGSFTKTVTVTDANTCVNTDDVLITVNPLPTGNNQLTTLCEDTQGGGVVSGIDLTTHQISINSGGVIYDWFSDISLSTVVAPLTGITVNNGQIFYVQVTDNATGCQNVATVSYTINSLPVPDAGTDQVICLNDNATITATSGGFAPINFSWDNGLPAGAGPHAINPTVGITTYHVTVTDGNGCVNMDSTQVTVNPIPIVIASNDTTICEGTSTTLAASGGITYQWKNLTTGADLSTSSTTTVQPTSSNTCYQVTGTDAQGCYNTDIVCITIEQAPATRFSVADICNGDFSIFNNTTTGGATYFWDFGDGNSSNVFSPQHFYTDTGSYTVTLTATSQSGCVSVFSETTNIDYRPSPLFVGDTLTGCPVFTTNFTKLMGAPIDNTFDYLWDFGDGYISRNTMPSHQYHATGNYTVSLTVTTPKGCAGTYKVDNYITVYPVPDAHFTVDPPIVDIYEPIINFTDLSVGADKWFWNFGDTTGAIEQHPIHLYSDTGSFTVWLKVENQFGCSDSTSRPVLVKDVYTFFAPNAFTPDGDGLNDVFLPQGHVVDYQEYALQIFDRWGELIHTTNDYSEGWDGSLNGSPVQIDTYVWKVHLQDIYGVNHRYIGKVNIIR